MAGRVPAIHVLPFYSRKDVDARHKAGHDGEKLQRSPSVIASAAKQSILAGARKLDCFVAFAPRNDGETRTPPHSHGAARSSFSLPREAWGGGSLGAKRSVRRVGAASASCLFAHWDALSPPGASRHPPHKGGGIRKKALRSSRRPFAHTSAISPRNSREFAQREAI